MIESGISVSPEVCKTRNIICFPLIDNQNIIFGVIQSINKKDGYFDHDDESLMEIFSIQASLMLKSAINKDEDNSVIQKYVSINSYYNKILNISNLYDFSKYIEAIFKETFKIRTMQVLFYDNECKGKTLKILYQYSLEFKKCDVGIVSWVYDKRQYFGYNSMQDCNLLNTSVDIETTNPIVTFPILGYKSQLFAIIQTEWPSKLLTSKRVPSTNDDFILKGLINILELIIMLKFTIVD